MKLFHSQDPISTGQRVFIAIPAYGNVPAEFLHSMWDARSLLLESGISTELLIASGGCHVDDVRNHLVSLFLASDCTDMVFIDDDTRFNAIDLVRLVRHKDDVVAGICPKKTYPLDFCFRPLPNCKATGYIEVEGVGTAFLKISKTAIEKLADNAEHYTAPISGVGYDIPLIFERTLEDGIRWGGDYSFCRKWAKLGGKMFVDTEMLFGHVGQQEYVGSLGAHIRATNGTTKQWIMDKLQELKGKGIEDQDVVGLSLSWGNGDWAADNGLLGALDMIAKEGTGAILECGSGLSTLVLGTSGRKVISLENNKSWADKVKAHAKGLDVDVRTSDLKGSWYSVDIPEEPSMVFIDGPPRGIADRSIIAEKITPADGCIFVVDDIANEASVLDALTSKFGIEFNNFGRYAIGVYSEIH